jgi:predicted short-subunit dehydrogenase-like oxidoreductase (DUF2520 family)
LTDLDALRFCVVGPGRLGSALARALDDAGLTVGALGVRGRVDETATPPCLPLVRAAREADVVLLTVPDDVIGAVAGQLAEALGPSAGAKFVVHCSGLVGLDVLEPLRSLGARVASLHPLQTFAGETSDDLLAGVPSAVTAHDEADLVLASALVERLGGRPFALADERKPLYHLAAAVASNLFVALQSEAIELMNEAIGAAGATSRTAAADDVEGRRVLAPLVRTTAANLLAVGPERALTGPVARGDVGTVRAHLALLQRHPQWVREAYRALSLQALALAAPRLDDERVRALKDLLGEGR